MGFIIFFVVIVIILVAISSKNNDTNKYDKSKYRDNEVSKSQFQPEQVNSKDPISIQQERITQNTKPRINANHIYQPSYSPTNTDQPNDKNSKITINGHTVEYIDSTHTYIVDGHRIPCVSDILSYYSRIHHLDDYSQVSQYTLQRAAQKGTDLHNAIEAYERGESYINYPEIDNYKTIKLKFGFEVIKMEQIVLYCNQINEPLYAGRLDMVISQQDQIGILDLKRTYKVYQEKFQLQLNLYRLAYEQSYHQKISKLFCMRLRESKANFYEFMIDEETAKDSIYSYLGLI